MQKALQITSGLKFMEIIDMIKKVTKTLKYTNYGKKIYENLMNNYGEYLSNQNTHKNSAKLPKKNIKKGLDGSIINNSQNYENNPCIGSTNTLKQEYASNESNHKELKKDNHVNIINNSKIIINNDQVKTDLMNKVNENTKKSQNNILLMNNKNMKNLDIRNFDSSKNFVQNSNNLNDDLFADLNKSFSQGRPRNGSLV